MLRENAACAGTRRSAPYMLFAWGWSLIMESYQVNVRVAVMYRE